MLDFRVPKLRAFTPISYWVDALDDRQCSVGDRPVTLEVQGIIEDRCGDCWIQVAFDGSPTLTTLLHVLAGADVVDVVRAIDTIDSSAAWPTRLDVHSRREHSAEAG
jgi:hypothetical protein